MAASSRPVQKNRRNLTTLFAEVLVPLGFVQQGRFFIRHAPECVQVVDVQGSRYSDQTYSNQTVWFTALGPYPGGEGAFHFNDRMDAAVPVETPFWQEVLRASDERVDRAVWAGEVRRLIEARLPLFDLVPNPATALAHHKAGRLAGCGLAEHLLEPFA